MRSYGLSNGQVAFYKYISENNRLRACSDLLLAAYIPFELSSANGSILPRSIPMYKVLT